MTRELTMFAGCVVGMVLCTVLAAVVVPQSTPRPEPESVASARRVLADVVDVDRRLLVLAGRYEIRAEQVTRAEMGALHQQRARLAARCIIVARRSP